MEQDAELKRLVGRIERKVSKVYDPTKHRFACLAPSRQTAPGYEVVL